MPAAKGDSLPGVLCRIDTIVEACKKETLDIPGFTIDPELAQRAGIDFVTGDAAHFIRHILGNAAGHPSPDPKRTIP
jgi:hypothetical protein